MKLDIDDKNFINKLNKIFHRKNIINGMKDTSFVGDKYEFTIDDLYYIMKFYGLGSNREEIGLINRKERRLFEKIFEEKKLNKLEEEYDNRILVIPKQIYFYPPILFKYYPILMSIDGLYVDENTKAIYLNNPDHLYPIVRVLRSEKTIIRAEHKENNIKYILLPENICINAYGRDIDQKIVPVPDDVKYSELKDILNDAIIKDKCLIKEYGNKIR